jgi:hypothetical protein
LPDDPHYIPPAERAKGEPGEGGCLRAEAEEREAEESAPEILAFYRVIMNPPPDQPYPSQALADMMARGEYPQGLRAPLKANFNQACRRREWEAFGFSEDQGRRVPVRSPWREELAYDDRGGLTDRNLRTHVEVLFYRVGTQPSAPQTTPEQREPDKDPPRDTGALRSKAKIWLARFVADGEHVDRDNTLKKMRDKHPGLGVRGSKDVFRVYSDANPELKLSAPGRRKSKRNTNN